MKGEQAPAKRPLGTGTDQSLGLSGKGGALVTHRLSWLTILSPVTLGTILALKG